MSKLHQELRLDDKNVIEKQFRSAALRLREFVFV